jgi:hypothetical protein
MRSGGSISAPDWFFQSFNRCGDPDHIGIAEGDLHVAMVRTRMRGSFHLVSVSDAPKCVQRVL